MQHANFAYSAPMAEAGGSPFAVSIFADLASVLAQFRDDATIADLPVCSARGVAALLDDGDVLPLGDVVLLDCPAITGTALAALVRLDQRAVRAGAQLIISTTGEALDDVFGCLDQSAPQILVDPSAGDRAIALGLALARLGRSRVCELGEEDRLALLRLTEHVSQLAQRLERIESPLRQVFEGSNPGAFRFESPKPAFAGAEQSPGDRLVRAARPSLPDPRLVRRIIRQRQLRARFFDGDLFADPAWDMLLDLTAARAEHTRVSVTSLCIASGVPPTTALRWIGQLIEAGLFERVEDDADRRRAFIALTDKAADAVARYFAEIGNAAERTV